MHVAVDFPTDTPTDYHTFPEFINDTLSLRADKIWHQSRPSEFGKDLPNKPHGHFRQTSPHIFIYVLEDKGHLVSVKTRNSHYQSDGDSHENSQNLATIVQTSHFLQNQAWSFFLLN